MEFDPTNGIIGTRDLIRVGVAREPRQAIPIAGTFIGAKGDYIGMDVEVKVERVTSPQDGLGGGAGPLPREGWVWGWGERAAIRVGGRHSRCNFPPP